MPSIHIQSSGLNPEIVALARRNVQTAMTRAVSYSARRTRTLAARQIREQVAFPATYLGDKAGNLSITHPAGSGNYTATITARGRPTSLARFVHGAKTPNRKKLTVEVKPNSPKRLERAFLIALRNGNLGLAIRLAHGESVLNKTTSIAMRNGLFLLYAPSVNQVFATLASELVHYAETEMEREFLRLANVEGIWPS